MPFDQFLNSLTNYVSGVVALDVETVIAQARNWGDKKIAVVWAREKSEGLGRYLALLCLRFHVFLVEYEPGKGFFESFIQNRKRASAILPLDKLLAPVAAVPHTPFKVSATVRDEKQITRSYLGFSFCPSKKSCEECPSSPNTHQLRCPALVQICMEPRPYLSR